MVGQSNVLRQAKERRDIVNRKHEEENRFGALQANVKELYRQYGLLEFESKEAHKLLIETIKSVENYGKNSRDAINAANQLLMDNKQNSNNIQSEYSLLEITIREIQENNLERFQDLPNIFSEEFIKNQTIEIDSELKEIAALVETETEKISNCKDERDHCNNDQKILMKSISSFTMSLRKLNIAKQLGCSASQFVNDWK